MVRYDFRAHDETDTSRTVASGAALDEEATVTLVVVKVTLAAGGGSGKSHGLGTRAAGMTLRLGGISLAKISGTAVADALYTR
jgi:hypothetical protein